MRTSMQAEIQTIIEDFDAAREAGAVAMDTPLDDFAMTWVSARAAEWRNEWNRLETDGMHAAEIAVLGY